jgi:hypothetical protein
LQYRISHHLQTVLFNHYELEKSVTLLCKTERKFTSGLIEIRSFRQLISRQGVTVASTVVKEVVTSLESIFLDMGKTDGSVFYLDVDSFALVCTNYLSNRQINGLVNNRRKNCFNDFSLPIPSATGFWLYHLPTAWR